jgi:small subunit ribosomal protein S17
MKEQRKRLVGRVTSDKMEKTVVVTIERTSRHPLYGKVLRRGRNYKAHNENNQAKAGDLVRIVESRPMSREKHWTVEAILRKAGE